MSKLNLNDKRAIKRRIKSLRRIVAIKTKVGVIHYSTHRLLFLEIKTLMKRLDEL